jgi:hypothetical protein
MENICEEELLGTFDQLVSEGVIVSGPHTKHETQDEGYPVSISTSTRLNPTMNLD